MSGLEMGLIRRRLSGCGFQVELFRYPSVRSTPAENARRLNQFILQRHYDCLHLVAHSLGGIVLLNLFDQFPDQPPGRVVLLGAPVQGSGVARRLSTRPWLRYLIGNAGPQGLLEGAPPWRSERELAVIAGTSGIGIGRLLGGLSGTSDGTVAVHETAVAAAVESRSYPAGHMGMLFSSAVAADIAVFLRAGRFPTRTGQGDSLS